MRHRPDYQIQWLLSDPNLINPPEWVNCSTPFAPFRNIRLYAKAESERRNVPYRVVYHNSDNTLVVADQFPKRIRNG